MGHLSAGAVGVRLSVSARLEKFTSRRRDVWMDLNSQRRQAFEDSTPEMSGTDKISWTPRHPINYSITLFPSGYTGWEQRTLTSSIFRTIETE